MASLRRAYIVALVLLAALALMKFAASERMLLASEGDAAVINLAGRQRMLSQKVAKLALVIEHAQTPALQQIAQAELHDVLDLWEASHTALRRGRPAGESDQNRIPAATGSIAEAYTEMQPSFVLIRDAARALAGMPQGEAGDSLESRHLIDVILRHERVFLPQMHSIVGLHADTARERVQALSSLTTLLLVTTLLVLVAEALFVFEPAARLMRRRLAELEASKEEAERLMQIKTDFLANMSHEIRTPMTAILGYADLLLEPELSITDRAEHIQTIRSNGEHLLGLLNDILDMSKIEAGKLEVERVACSPGQLVEDTMSLMRHKASQKGLAVKTIVDGPVPANVAADPLRVRQILVNLMGNAIKFTKQGTVLITSRMTRDDTQHWLEIAVTDTGIGMSPDALARIFEAFGQAESSTTRQFGGTGLGLSISKNLAEAMGGSITVASVEGQGSTFTLRLPAGDNPELSTAAPEAFADADGGTTTSVEGKPLQGVRILLAEDGIDNQKLIMFHLNKAGAATTLVDNGKDAFEIARDLTDQFDLVLMDVQMPVMDGLVATSSIRQFGITLPILALTANAMQQDRERCMTAGCDDFLTKPINAPKLINTCARWAKRKPRRNAA